MGPAGGEVRTPDDSLNTTDEMIVQQYPSYLGPFHGPNPPKTGCKPEFDRRGKFGSATVSPSFSEDAPLIRNIIKGVAVFV